MIPIAVLLTVIALFALGYFFTPKGRLTKIFTISFDAIMFAHQWLQEQFHVLAELIPPDWVPWFMGTALGLTVIAAIGRPEWAIIKRRGPESAVRK